MHHLNFDMLLGRGNTPCSATFTILEWFQLPSLRSFPNGFRRNGEQAPRYTVDHLEGLQATPLPRQVSLLIAFTVTPSDNQIRHIPVH